MFGCFLLCWIVILQFDHQSSGLFYLLILLLSKRKILREMNLKNFDSLAINDLLMCVCVCVCKWWLSIEHHWWWWWWKRASIGIKCWMLLKNLNERCLKKKYNTSINKVKNTHTHQEFNPSFFVLFFRLYWKFFPLE